MFTLAAGLLRAWTHLDEYNVVLVGPAGAGKTTLALGARAVLAHVPRPTTPPHPTVGLAASHVAHRNVQLNLWDLGGATDLRVLWRSYYPAAHVVLFVLDATANHVDLVDARDALATLLQDDETAHIPILILANKADLPTAVSRNVLTQLLAPLAPALQDHPSAAWRISATSDDPIPAIFDWIVDSVQANIHLRPAQRPTP